MKFKDIQFKAKKTTTDIDYNNQTFTIKHCITVSEKLQFIEEVVNLTTRDASTFQPMTFKIYFELWMVKYYSNIEFDDEVQVEEIYDQLSQSGLLCRILDTAHETDLMQDIAMETIENLYYFNSTIVGVITNLFQDKSQVAQEFRKIMEELNTPENQEKLKNIIEFNAVANQGMGQEI